MKHNNIPYCCAVFITLILLCSSPSNAGPFNSEKHSMFSRTSKTHITDSDSLPRGVSKQWLNTLTDENGGRVFNEEEPETDALQQNIFNGSAAGENYGRSVANAGDVNGDGFDDVIVGAPNSNEGGLNGGKVYIYFGGTVIDNSPDVTGVDGAGKFAGCSVSSAGDVNGDGYGDVIIGAYGFSSFKGMAYILYGGSPMNGVADVILTGEAAGHEFGKAVSGAGDLNGDGYDDVVIGARAANAYTGKAYIFYGGAAMNNVADLVMSGEFSNDEFGCSVSGAGDVNADGFADALIGAVGSNSSIGKSYVYLGGVSMNNTSDITLTGEGFLSYFGASVSGAGDLNDDGYSDVIVGAYGFDGNTGRAYVFYGGTVMNSLADVTMTGEFANNSFGFSVSEAGDINGDGFGDVFIGAYGYGTSKGRAYLYYGGSAMNGSSDIFVTGEAALNYFGYSVSGGGDMNNDGFSDMIVGAFGYSSSKGRAYVFTNTSTGNDISDVSFTGTAQSHLGSEVAKAGDVNADGFADLIVSARSISQVFIYFGGTIPDNTPDVVMTGTVGEFFGEDVSTAGDVNGDSYDDVIIGVPKNNSQRGRAYIFYGGANMDNVADVIISGSVVDEELGFSVANAGDVNGDNYDDVIAGGRGEPGVVPGSSYIYYGGASMNNVADVTLNAEGIFDEYGSAVSSAGDVNGDGYSDVLVGAPGYSQLRGRAYLYYGGASMNSGADVVFTGENVDNEFAGSLSGAGDIDDDGYDDVVIGAYGYAGYRGRIYIYKGGSAMNNISDFTFQGNSPPGYLGLSVCKAGDVNNDGYADVTVGVPGYDTDRGQAYVLFGGSAMGNPNLIMSGENQEDFFGGSVAGAGDVNGDGKDDLIVGAPDHDNGAGKAYLFLSSFPDNRKTLFLFGAIQGMYDPSLNTEVPDTIKVYLRNSTSPFARVDSSKNVLLGPLTGQQFVFRNVRNSLPYYVEVTHRNALTTWSASPVTFVNSDASIAFSVDDIYAYGNNEIQVDTEPYNVFAFYSGDVNQDGTIDVTDLGIIDNDAYNFISGYAVTDLTGDNNVDISDLLIADNNAANFVGVIRP